MYKRRGAGGYRGMHYFLAGLVVAGVVEWWRFFYHEMDAPDHGVEVCYQKTSIGSYPIQSSL